MTPDSPPPSDHDEDLGEPISELQDLPLPVDDRFGRQVRNRIERRLVTTEFLDLAWTAPLMMFLEFLRIPLDVFGGNRRS